MLCTHRRQQSQMLLNATCAWFEYFVRLAAASRANTAPCRRLLHCEGRAELLSVEARHHSIKLACSSFKPPSINVAEDEPAAQARPVDYQGVLQCTLTLLSSSAACRPCSRNDSLHGPWFGTHFTQLPAAASGQLHSLCNIFPILSGLNLLMFKQVCIQQSPGFLLPVTNKAPGMHWFSRW
jgi:hypothetical protein